MSGQVSEKQEKRIRCAYLTAKGNEMAEESSNGEEGKGFKVSDRRFSVRGYDDAEEEESSSPLPEEAPPGPVPSPESPPMAEDALPLEPPPPESPAGQAGEAEPAEGPGLKGFETLLAILQGNALAAMGLHPQTGERVGGADPRNAKLMVDLIGVMKDKMAGNLTEDEGKLISQVLSDLQMIYVQQVGIG